MLTEGVWSLLGDKKILSALKQALLQLRFVQFLDPNDRNNRRAKPERVAFIPIGTDGHRRVGARELLLKTKQDHPDRSVIATEAHATKILFSEGPDHVPMARGVEIAEGGHLYKASPIWSEGSPARRRYFATDEVTICGGAYNTPQLLMLSGIGDENHLKIIGIDHVLGVDGQPLSPIIHLPGVGSNLQDRYEIGVISELERDFTSLKGVSFIPGDPKDPQRRDAL